MAETDQKKPMRGEGALRIYEGLRREILAMTLSPGDLLDEKSIAAQFEVSRSPVREAIIRLASDGLVRTLPNKSAMVAPLNIEEFPAYLDALDLMQRATTRLAASLRTPEDLAIIKARQAEFEEAVSRGDAIAMIETNRNFHIAISNAGKNRYFTMLYTRLLDEGRRMLRLYFLSLGDSLPPELAVEHHQIIEAIERRDPDRAEALAHEHAEQVGTRFLQHLGARHTADMPVKRVVAG